MSKGTGVAAARCSPNQLGSPLSIAVAANDQESVEDLLLYRADPTVASEGEDPPLCSAVRDRRRDIVRSFVLYRADANAHSLPPTPAALGLIPLELQAMIDWWNCLRSIAAYRVR